MPTLNAIVGDIHGCLDQLEHLEDRLARHAARQGADLHIVSVGDLVDRGPDSAGVVRHLRRGAAAGTHTTLLGNHEQMMLATIHTYAPQLLADAGCILPRAVMTFDATFEAKKSMSSQWFPRDVYKWFRALMWLGQGGVPTLKSYGVEQPTDPSTWRVDPDDLRFLCGLPLVWRCEGAVVTHALTTAEGLEGLASDNAEVYTQAVDLALWGRIRPDDPPDPQRTHVSGHSILPKVRRDRRRQLVQLDTGAFRGARLSAWCVETDRVITVGPVAP